MPRGRGFGFAGKTSVRLVVVGQALPDVNIRAQLGDDDRLDDCQVKPDLHFACQVKPGWRNDEILNQVQDDTEAGQRGWQERRGLLRGGNRKLISPSKPANARR